VLVSMHFFTSAVPRSYAIKQCMLSAAVFVSSLRKYFLFVPLHLRTNLAL
jgi:hypothetical protein